MLTVRRLGKSPYAAIYWHGQPAGWIGTGGAVHVMRHGQALPALAALDGSTHGNTERATAAVAAIDGSLGMSTAPAPWWLKDSMA